MIKNLEKFFKKIRKIFQKICASEKKSLVGFKNMFIKQNLSI